MQAAANKSLVVRFPKSFWKLPNMGVPVKPIN
jgi:hypothetical protein